MIIFRPKSVKTILFINPSDALGVLSRISQFPELSNPGRLRPWVLHAPGAMMTVVNTNSLNLCHIILYYVTSYYIILCILCVSSRTPKDRPGPLYHVYYENACPCGRPQGRRAGTPYHVGLVQAANGPARAPRPVDAITISAITI